MQHLYASVGKKRNKLISLIVDSDHYKVRQDTFQIKTAKTVQILASCLSIFITSVIRLMIRRAYSAPECFQQLFLATVYQFVLQDTASGLKIIGLIFLNGKIFFSLQ